MKRKTWRKYHKWIGIIITFFLVMFCLSGIVLNHRQLFSDINVSRGILPGQIKCSYMAQRVSFKLIQLPLTSPNITKGFLLVLTIDKCEEWLKPHKITCLRLVS